MSQELTISNRTSTETMSFLERIKSWGRNPKVAEQRLAKADRKIGSYNLRCRYGQESTFDVAVTVTSDRQTMHLKNTIEKIDCDVPAAALIESNANGQTGWVLVDIGDRRVSISRRRLNSALQALGIIPPI